MIDSRIGVALVSHISAERLSVVVRHVGDCVQVGGLMVLSNPLGRHMPILCVLMNLQARLQWTLLLDHRQNN